MLCYSASSVPGAGGLGALGLVARFARDGLVVVGGGGGSTGGTYAGALPLAARKRRADVVATDLSGGKA